MVPNPRSFLEICENNCISKENASGNDHAFSRILIEKKKSGKCSGKFSDKKTSLEKFADDDWELVSSDDEIGEMLKKHFSKKFTKVGKGPLLTEDGELIWEKVKTTRCSGDSVKSGKFKKPNV